MKRTASQIGRYKRTKGARGEREAAAYLSSLGFRCQRNGRNGISTGDLHGLSECLPNVHIEVKFGYASMDLHTADLRAAWEQAATVVRQECCVCLCGVCDNEMECDRRAVVLWRPLRKPWRLTWAEKCGLVTTTGDDAIKTKLLELNGAAKTEVERG